MVTSRRTLRYLLALGTVLASASSILLGEAYHFSYLDNFFGKGAILAIVLLVCIILDAYGKRRVACYLLSVGVFLGIVYSIGRPGWSRTSSSCYAMIHYGSSTFASDLFFWAAVAVSALALIEMILLRRGEKA